jgi:dihydroorotase
VLIKGGRLVDPARAIEALRDVRIHDGCVSEVGEHLQADPGEPAVDASNAYVAPGFIDMHVHLREPGDPEKETLATGTAAAAAGGFTAVAAMPNTRPAIDTPELVRTVAAAGAAVRVYPIAAITKGRRGEELLDYEELAHAGAVAFSDDGSTIADARVQLQAALRAGDHLLITHCLDERLQDLGCDDLAEEVIVARDVLIAQSCSKRWHIAHVSTRRAIELIREARLREGGARITCEATPHHLVFTQEYFLEHGGRGKVNPPLRSRDDVAALRDAVRDGTVDALACDHAPHTAAEKECPARDACVGFSGLEIAVGAYALALPGLPLQRFVELLSTAPARILGVRGGALSPGSPGDVTIFADRPWTVDTRRFKSKGRSTPFDGMKLPRRVLTTIVGGEVVYA